MEFNASSDKEYLSGNGRYFYAPQGWFSAGDRLYLPYELLSRLLCLDTEIREDETAIYISTLNARLIPGGRITMSSTTPVRSCSGSAR
ncbi:MAG: hypothetical protein V8T45_12815 [Oscillospiraceae bacterium]